MFSLNSIWTVAKLLL